MLEMAPPGRDGREGRKGKSSTEDEDSEAFWAAAEGDFSFFGDEDEAPTTGTRPAKTVPAGSRSSAYGGKDPLNQPGFKPTSERAVRSEEMVDVVAEIAKFRRERKTAFEEAWKKGTRYVDGYWPGEIQVIRPYG